MKLAQLLKLLDVYSLTPAEFFGDGVEQRLFGEFRSLRALPEHAHAPLGERFLQMIEGVAVSSGSRLRAV